MKSLLVVTPRYPYPPIGGDRLRIYHLCRILSSRYRLTLLSLCDEYSECVSEPPSDGIFSRVERVYLPRWRSRLNVIRALPSSVPSQVAYYRSAPLRARMAELVDDHDAIFAHLIRVGDVVRHVDIPRFLEMTDALSLNYGRGTGLGRHSWRDIRPLIYRLEKKRLEQYERDIVDEFNHSFLVSSVDRDYLFKNDPARLRRTSVASNGVDLSLFPFQFSELSGDLVFIGDMRTLPNQDAIYFMANRVLPLVRESIPDASIRVIGRISDHDRQDMQRLPGVQLTGFVDNVATAARHGAVGVCPIRRGAGVQNKILEYMALGLPVVSTTLGAEGLNVSDGKELLIADSERAFAEATVQLCTNRVRARELAASARAYVESEHSWEAQLEPALSEIARCLESS